MEPQVVLAILHDPSAAPAVCRAARQLAQLLGGAQVRALAIRVPAIDTIMPTEEILDRERETEWDAAERARIATLRQICATEAGAALRVERGGPDEVVEAYGGGGDYLVVSRPAETSPPDVVVICRAALFVTNRPVLVVPPTLSGGFGDRVAIAFRPDGRAEKAVRAALALLPRAQRVRVFGDGGIPALLLSHAAPAEPFELGDHGFAATLLAEIARGGDDLLVMGAFAHSPLREAVLGGVTRHVLRHAAIPVLMSH